MKIFESCIVNNIDGLLHHVMGKQLTSHFVEVTENFTVLAKHYEAVLRPEASLQAYLRCTVAETKQSYAHQENFNLSKPDLVIKVAIFLYHNCLWKGFNY